MGMSQGKAGDTSSGRDRVPLFRNRKEGGGVPLGQATTRSIPSTGNRTRLGIGPVTRSCGQTNTSENLTFRCTATIQDITEIEKGPCQKEKCTYNS